MEPSYDVTDGTLTTGTTRDNTFSAGDEITLTRYCAQVEKTGAEGEETLLSGGFDAVAQAGYSYEYVPLQQMTVPVAGVLTSTEGLHLDISGWYGVVASDAFLEALLYGQALPADTEQFAYLQVGVDQGALYDQYGVWSVNVWANDSASYVNTDQVIDQISAQFGCTSFQNYRAQYAALRQEALQDAYLAILLGGMLLLVLVTLRYALTSANLHQRRQEVGILQALGMSPARLRRRLIGSSLGWGAGTLAAALAVWMAYLLRQAQSYGLEDGWSYVWSLWGIFLVHPVTLGICCGGLLGLLCLADCLPMGSALRQLPLENLRNQEGGR